METIKVKDVAHLRELIASGKHHYFIKLNFGLRSLKFICLNGNDFGIFNEIDGTEDVLDEAQLMDERYTNVGKAINYGALFCEF